jgi:TRAP-type mannitol/chloroaromatic compound transport system substrate-binding protein
MVRHRRRFFTTASGAMVAVAAASITDAPNVIAQPKVQWPMSTTRTPALDVLQGAAQRLAEVVDDIHEVPGAGGPLGPRRRRRLPSVRRGVR